MNRRRFVTPLTAYASALAALAPTGAIAVVDYHLIVDSANKKLSIEITVPTTPGSVSIQIPNWSPGSYSYGNFPDNIHDVQATDAAGKALQVTHPDKNTWTVSTTDAGYVKFAYWLPWTGQRRFAQASDDSFVQVSGPSTYMYVVGRKEESCKLTVDVPEGWPILVGLDNDGEAANHFGAPSYDTLADNPISTGSSVLVDHYILHGKDHAIVLEGAAKDKVDRTRLLRDCRFVSAAETDFFGSVPYNKYVWHFSVYDAPDGAGGLEHLSSTQISLASGEGQRTQSVLAHEFFHLWNVKRARAKVLGPFDYLTLPKTGNLWWLEGVTDYYATLLPYRYGEWNRRTFYDGIIRNLDAVRRNPARLEVSPYQSSFRVGDANAGRGNSNGYQISYYNLGWLCGLCLDTEIRTRSNGHNSLDDVARALYDLCKDGHPGFEEDEIRKQCARFGGPELGPFYDKVVMSPGELPVEDQLQKMGVKLLAVDQGFSDAGFTATPMRQGGGARLTDLHGPAEGKLMDGDVLVSINDQPLEGLSGPSLTQLLRNQTDGVKVGTPLNLKVKRGDQVIAVTIDPVAGTRKVHKIEEDTSALASEVQLREQWLQAKLAGDR